MYPQDLGVKFILFNNQTNDTLTYNSDDTLVEKTFAFDPDLSTKVIIHGFQNGYKETNWMGVRNK